MKSGLLLSMLMTLCVMSMTGCETLSNKNQAEKLSRSVTHYGAALRWARHREAISYHVTRDAKFAEVNIEDLENFGVTSVEVLSKTIVPSAEKGGVTEAAIVVEISYFHKEQGTVRKLKLNQIWWYNADIKRWLIETEFPEFK
ncbi:MAG: hypothetical protein ACI9ZT_000262 [Gammaproteobacteria bacterium]|jgi:hypothetical protein